jgi:hypothetical protein
MNVKLTYLNDNVQTIYNITEFHHLFDIVEKCSAFESDIHSTGMTHKLSDLRSIEVMFAKQIHKSYYIE